MSKVPTEIKSLARAHTETAINTLAGIMRQPDAPAAARVAAASILLDRGWGKAVQPIAGADGESEIKVTLIEIVAPAMLSYEPQVGDDDRTH